ncbi:MAG: 30S ribosomal protein S6 [Candidatus Omnitrophica bacterium]|nr:30S ribosomal protein S6 [Candidatus Omnitrophota bacterium]
MNNYEGVFIIRPEIKEEDVKNIFKTINDMVSKNGGNIKKEEPWGKRPLSYPVNKLKEAYYYKLDFEAPSSAVAKVEAACKLNADIARIMITRR